jgi:WD40 repeat protein
MSESTQTPHFHPLQLQRPVVASVPAPMRVIPGSRRTVSGSHKNTIEVWYLETGEVLGTFSGDGALNACAVSPDRKTIVAGEVSGRMHFLRLEGEQ